MELKINLQRLLWITAIFCMTRCGKSYLPSDYVRMVEDEESGLRKTAGVDSNISMQVQLKPYDYILCMEKKSNDISRKERNQVHSELEGHLYFTVSYACRDGESVHNYLSRVYGTPLETLHTYFERNVGSSFFLLTATGDTLERVLSNYEYSHNVSPYERFNLVFEAGDENQWPLEFRLHNLVSGEVNSMFFNSSEYFNLPGIKTL